MDQDDHPQNFNHKVKHAYPSPPVIELHDLERSFSEDKTKNFESTYGFNKIDGFDKWQIDPVAK